MNSKVFYLTMILRAKAEKIDEFTFGFEIGTETEIFKIKVLVKI